MAMANHTNPLILHSQHCIHDWQKLGVMKQDINQGDMVTSSQKKQKKTMLVLGVSGYKVEY